MGTYGGLSRTRTVLRRDDGWRNGPDRPTFLTDQPGARSTQVILDAEVYEDMGRPDAITVTVRPGDKLNK